MGMALGMEVGTGVRSPVTNDAISEAAAKSQASLKPGVTVTADNSLSAQ